MKKLFKGLASVLAAFVLLVSLASCSKVSQSYADKINKAAEDGEALTVEQVQKDLGDEAQSYLVLNSGVIVAVKGVKSKEDLEKKLDEEDKVEGLIVTCVLGKATAAAYEDIDLSDLK